MLNALVQPLATILAGIVAAAVLIFVDRRRGGHENRRWLLDRQHQAYVDFARCITEVEKAGNDHREILKAMRPLVAANEVLLLVASDEVTDAANEVVKAGFSVGDRCEELSKATDPDEKEAATARRADAVSSFHTRGSRFLITVRVEFATLGQTAPPGRVTRWAWIAVGASACVTGVAALLLLLGR